MPRGANIGTFAVLAASLGARVKAFEPEPENFELLRANLRLNGFEPSVEVFREAVGLHEGSADLHLCKSQRNKYRHTLVEKPKWNSIRVPVAQFSELLDGVTAVKLDIEGAEMDILDERHDWQDVQRLVMEYHFDVDNSLANFYRRMETLAETFGHVHHRKMPAGPTWDHFPFAVIASLWR